MNRTHETMHTYKGVVFEVGARDGSSGTGWTAFALGIGNLASEWAWDRHSNARADVIAAARKKIAADPGLLAMQQTYIKRNRDFLANRAGATGGTDTLRRYDRVVKGKAGSRAAKPARACRAKDGKFKTCAGKRGRAASYVEAKPSKEEIRATVKHLKMLQQARAEGYQGSFTTDPAWLVNEAINRRGGYVEDPQSRGSALPVGGRFPKKGGGDYARHMRQVAHRINTPRLRVYESELGALRSDLKKRLPNRFVKYEDD